MLMKFSVTELGGIDEDMKLQIHCLEKEAYSHVLRAFIAQSDLLSWVCYSVYDLLLCNSFLTANYNCLNCLYLAGFILNFILIAVLQSPTGPNPCLG